MRFAERSRWLILPSLFWIVSGLSFAASDSERPIRQGSVEVLFGNYDMNEPRFDAVYPSGGLIAGLALSAAIVSDVNFYLEAKYYTRRGELSFTKEETDLYLLPISLGLRYILPLGIFNPYFGAGADFYFYYEENPIGTTLDYAGGYHFTGGTYVRFTPSVPVMLNLKVKYTWARAEQEGVRVQLGGLEYGAGLVFTF